MMQSKRMAKINEEKTHKRNTVANAPEFRCELDHNKELTTPTNVSANQRERNENFQEDSKETAKESEDRDVLAIDNEIALQTDQEEQNKSSSGKRRRGKSENGKDETHPDEKPKKRKSKLPADEPKVNLFGDMQLPDFMTDTKAVPEISALNSRLMEINKKLMSCKPLDSLSKDSSSPYPNHLLDKEGKIFDTSGEFEMLRNERQEIISLLIQMNPAFRVPPDYSPSKLFKKLYIPIKEFPDYNFVGLIIGPCGNTLKRMEKESGAKILVRGRGSEKARRYRSDTSESEDLHVLVESEKQASLDKAVAMIEKILVPVEEDKNEHKLAQLKELAALRRSCSGKCNQPDQRKEVHFFPSDSEGLSTLGSKHATKNDSSITEQTGCKFSLNLGRGGSEISSASNGSGKTGPTPSRFSYSPYVSAQPFYRTASSLLTNAYSEKKDSDIAKQWYYRPTESGTGKGTRRTEPNFLQVSHAKLGLPPGNESRKGTDESNLYVGYLPTSVDDAQLFQLFSRFGLIEKLRVMKNLSTGHSKGYGFVKYFDVSCAAEAVRRMDGFSLQGKTLAVRVAGRPLSISCPASTSAAPAYARQFPQTFSHPPIGNPLQKHHSVPSHLKLQYGSYEVPIPAQSHFSIQAYRGSPRFPVSSSAEIGNGKGNVTGFVLKPHCQISQYAPISEHVVGAPAHRFHFLTAPKPSIHFSECPASSLNHPECQMPSFPPESSICNIYKNST